MRKFSLSSLRSRAVYLVLLAILPLLALILYSYFHQRARAIREVQRDELVAARNLATIQENIIHRTKQVLMLLARLPQVQHRNRETCDHLFASLLEEGPYYTVIVAADPNGNVFASAPVFQQQVNIADRLFFRKAVETRGFVVGEPVLGRISKKYSLNFGFPIIDDAGKIQGVLAAGIDLTWLGGLLAKSDFPPTTAIVLTDDSRKVLFRYPEPLKYMGHLLPEAFMKPMASSNEGVAAGVGLPGDPRLFAFARLSPPWQNLWVSIGLPRDWAVAPVNRALWRNLIWLGLVALCTLAAAWYGGALFVVRPVTGLIGVTERLAAGELTARAGANYPTGELGLLAHSFDKMAAALQENELALRESQRRASLLADLLESSSQPFGVGRLDGGIEFFNSAYSGMLGYSKEEFQNLNWAQELTPPEWYEREQAQLHELHLTGHPVRYEKEYIRKDGRRMPVELLVHLRRDEPGQAPLYYAFITDITARKQAEQALRQTHDELERRVKERTEELQHTVATLQEEVAERQKAEQALQKSEQNLRYFTSKVLSAQEQERKRVAMDLHEGLAQSLTSIKMFLRGVQRHLPPRMQSLQEDFDALHNLIIEMVEEIRRISKGLSPALLEDMGLTAAFKHLLNELSKIHKIAINHDIDDLQNLFSHQTEINLFRVFQESLNNIAKHAQASQVSVIIKRQDSSVNFLIKDNGVGFDLKQIIREKSTERGMGLMSMDERLRMIGAQLNIMSQPGMGTEISFSTPIDAM